jgi:hypothetical protein
MCFCATASFTTAGALAVIGVLTLREASSQQMRLIAFIPLVFSLQQFLEGLVWITLTTGDTNGLLHHIGVKGFLIFAGVFWPIWVPLILYRFEQNHWRKRLLQVNLWGGIFIGALSVFLIITTGHQAQIVANHIAYPLLAGTFEHYLVSYGRLGYFAITALYLYVTVGSSFISTIRYIWILGLLSGIGFVIAQIFYAYAFGSVWCFVAAIISMATYFIVKRPT